MRRREARRLVLQSLYQREFLDISDSELLDEVDLGDQESYIRLTLSGISKHLPVSYTHLTLPTKA